MSDRRNAKGCTGGNAAGHEIPRLQSSRNKPVLQVVGRLQQILDADVAAFNDMVAALNLPPVVISER